MLQHNDQAHCVNCGTGLQHHVKYCPFCGTAQLLDLQSDPVVTETEVVSKAPIAPAGWVSHFTRKGKHLEGIILADIDLEAAKAYDRFAFKKLSGIFIRLEHVSKVPDHLLSADQLQLKQQQCALKSSPAELLDQTAPAQNKTQQTPSVEQTPAQSAVTARSASTADFNTQKTTIPQAVKATTAQQLDPLAEIQAAAAQKTQHHTSPQALTDPFASPAQPTSTASQWSKLKYFLIPIFAIILYMVFFKDQSAPEPSTVETPPAAAAAVESPVENCDLPNGQLLSLLQQHKPSRALGVVEMYQQECQHNRQFMSYRQQAQKASDYAVQKFNLAQNYLSANNVDAAETILHQTLEIDSELAEAHELLAAIEQYKAQQVKAEQAPADELEALIQDVETRQQARDASNDERRRIEAQQQAQARQQTAAQEAQQQLAEQQAKQQAQQKAAEQQAQQAKQQAQQKAAEQQAQQAKQQAQQKAAEQQAKREAEVQKAEQLKAQKLNNTLASADRALRQKNYGTAKNLAQQVIAQDPNHPVAKRILKQAEAGEAKAFDDMVIE